MQIINVPTNTLHSFAYFKNDKNSALISVMRFINRAHSRKTPPVTSESKHEISNRMVLISIEGTDGKKICSFFSSGSSKEFANGLYLGSFRILKKIVIVELGLMIIVFFKCFFLNVFLPLKGHVHDFGQNLFFRF